MNRKLIKVGFLMTLVGVMGGGMGYVFQILMGRMLGPQDFALFAAIMSVAVVMMSPISAVFTVVSRNITQASVLDRYSFVRRTYSRFMSINILGSILLFGFSSLFASEIGSYIKNSSELQVALLVGIISVSSFGMLNNSFLQGGQRYLWLAGTGLSTVTLKIILAVGFVWMGYGVDGALLGALLSALTANIAVMFVVKSGAPSLSDSQDPASLCKVVFNMERLFPVLVANVCMSIMMQLDVLLVHNFFTTADASKYAAAATLGKAILYLPGGLVLALFPMVAEAQARKSRVGTYIFTASAMTLGMCLAGVLFYWLAGEFLIRQFFGEKYVGAEEILKYYSLAMIPMALLIVTEYFMMALGKVIFAWLTFFFAPIQVIIIYFYHDNLFRVIATVGISGLILLFCGYLFLFRLIGAKLRFSE